MIMAEQRLNGRLGPVPDRLCLRSSADWRSAAVCVFAGVAAAFGFAACVAAAPYLTRSLMTRSAQRLPRPVTRL